LTVPWDQIGRLSHDEEATRLHVERVLEAMRDAGLAADPSLLGEGLKVAVDCVNGSGVQGGDARQWLGTLVALAVPVAGAVNWTLLQHLKTRAAGGHEAQDMLPAVLLGALISAAVTLPLAWPLQASAHDVGWLAMLGVVQLAIPCLLAVAAARVLSGPEISLLALLEVVFGVAWAWLGAGESPSLAVLGGGALVLLALAGNELLALRRARAAVS
jgi:drug/metabolite transporter (DMT)-like permease